MNTKKLSEILSAPIVHCEFEKETRLFFADGSILYSEFSEGQYGTGTWYSDIEVRWFDPSGVPHNVEVDTVIPKKEKR